jgi:antitoxin YefM
MRTINFSEARSNLKEVLDRVVEDADVTIITRRDADDVVVMSLDSFNSWRETLHLMSSPANARRLNESIAQARAGKARPRTLAAGDVARPLSVHEPRATYAVKPRSAARKPGRTRKR